MIDLSELIPVPEFALTACTPDTYPANQLAYLTVEQMESIATTPLELALIARLQQRDDELAEALDTRDVKDIAAAVETFKERSVNNALAEANNTSLKEFFDSVVEHFALPEAEPHDETVREAVVADIQLGLACREFTQYLIDSKFITVSGDVYNPIEIGTAVINHWPTLRD